MPATVEKPDDRSVEELLNGLKKSLEQIRSDETKHWREVKKDFQQK